MSSPEMRSKKDLIDKFIANLNNSADVDGDWNKFVKENKDKDLDKIIAEEKLDAGKTKRFMDLSFKNGKISDEGTDLSDCLPPISMRGGKRQQKKRTVLEKLRAFFEKYFGI